MQTEGPTLVPERIIKEPAYNTCFYCKYYDNSLKKSGINPEYYNHCLHSNAWGKIGNSVGRELSILGTIPVTPYWCPFLNNNGGAVPRETSGL